MSGHTHTPAEWLAVLSVASVVYGAGAGLVVAAASRTAEDLKAVPSEVRALVARAVQVARIEAVAVAYWLGQALARSQSAARAVASQALPLLGGEPEEVPGR